MAQVALVPALDAGDEIRIATAQVVPGYATGAGEQVKGELDRLVFAVAPDVLEVALALGGGPLGRLDAWPACLLVGPQRGAQIVVLLEGLRQRD